MAGIKQKLCRKLAHAFGLQNVLLFSSCRNALYALLKSLNLRKDDEVIIQAFICDSLTLAITKAGATPKKVEVNPHTLNLDAQIVTQNITPQTKALIFVHTYGNPSGIKEIRDLCKERKIILIEDIAHALGARYNGKLAGTFGDYAVYSFTKQMVNIGGGALLTNHDVRPIIALQQAQRGRPPCVDYVKRLIGSLYETRAFFPSKVIIDFVRKRANLKLAQELSPHGHCSKAEAFIAYHQVDTVLNDIPRRKNNYDLLREIAPAQVQKVIPGALSAYSYLSLRCATRRERDSAVQKQDLSLPSWPGSAVSDFLLFVPNRPSFSIEKLRSFARVMEENKTFINRKKIKR